MIPFTAEMVAEAEAGTVYSPLPAAVREALPAVLEEATNAFWERLGQLMTEHGISGDDLGWSGFDEWPPTVTRWVVELLAGNTAPPKVGDHVQIVESVDRYPHFVCPAGWTGEVTDVTEGLISVRMYRYLGPGAEEWSNEIVFNGGDDDEFHAFCRILGEG